MVPVEVKTKVGGTQSAYYQDMRDTLDFYEKMRALAAEETPYFESGGQRKYLYQMCFVCTHAFKTAPVVFLWMLASLLCVLL